METLPEGFTYKSTSLDASRVTFDPTDMQNITFAVVLEQFALHLYLHGDGGGPSGNV